MLTRTIYDVARSVRHCVKCDCEPAQNDSQTKGPAHVHRLNDATPIRSP